MSAAERDAIVTAWKRHAARGRDETHDGPWCVCGARWDYTDSEVELLWPDAWNGHLASVALRALRRLEATA